MAVIPVASDSLIPVKAVMGQLWRGLLNAGLTMCYLLRGAFGDGVVNTVLKHDFSGSGSRPRLSESPRGRLDCVQLSKSSNLTVLLKWGYVLHSRSAWVKCPRHSDCVYLPSSVLLKFTQWPCSSHCVMQQLQTGTLSAVNSFFCRFTLIRLNGRANVIDILH